MIKTSISDKNGRKRIELSYNNNIIGFANVVPNAGRNQTWMTDLFIQPEYRNKGFSKKLFGKVKSLFPDRLIYTKAYSYGDLGDDQLIDLYQTLGFKPYSKLKGNLVYNNTKEEPQMEQSITKSFSKLFERKRSKKNRNQDPLRPRNIKNYMGSTEWVVPGKIMKSARPGYNESGIKDPRIVDSWLRDITNKLGKKPKAVVVFLTDRELSYQYKFDLIAEYKKRGLDVYRLATHDPINDLYANYANYGYVEKAIFSFRDFSHMEDIVEKSLAKGNEPLLFHCSAGMDRSGRMAQYLKKKYNVEPEEKEDDDPIYKCPDCSAIVSKTAKNCWKCGIKFAPDEDDESENQQEPHREYRKNEPAPHISDWSGFKPGTAMNKFEKRYGNRWKRGI